MSTTVLQPDRIQLLERNKNLPQDHRCDGFTIAGNSALLTQRKKLENIK